MADRDLDVFQTVYLKYGIPIAILFGGGNEVTICVHIYMYSKLHKYNDVVFNVRILILLRRVMSERQQFQ